MSIHLYQGHTRGVLVADRLVDWGQDSSGWSDNPNAHAHTASKPIHTHTGVMFMQQVADTRHTQPFRKDIYLLAFQWHS